MTARSQRGLPHKREEFPINRLHHSLFIRVKHKSGGIFVRSKLLICDEN